MFIVWGWGTVTRHNKGDAFVKICTHCNQTTTWRLCVMMTWFTIFFIPIIPYKRQYAYICPRCKSYIPLTKEQYLEAKEAIANQNMNSTSNNSYSQTHDNNNDTYNNSNAYDNSNTYNNNNYAYNDAKYQGKTETQINYLKQMEEYEKSLNNK